MASNKINVDIIVTDKGSIKLTKKSAEKLNASVQQIGKSVQDTDRFWKGASQQSSNTTKNFSKMQQTMSSGLVPAYAALAANIFALSAAFQFLKKAGDLATLQQGQIAYAASTGVALKTLSNRIIQATEAQVTFNDASQAAAIGTAAGLNQTQLVSLGKAAKDVSIVLGRDVTDSFNRLVRGVTKAEPELLDELGIVLRLKTATEKYAASIGKTATELTAFERSQAVANEVLTQTEDKYSAIIDVVDPSINQFNKFGKAFDDVVNKFKSGLNSLLGPIAEFLAANPFAAILIAVPLLNGILRAMIPEFQNLGTAASNALLKISTNLEKIQRSSQLDIATFKVLSGDANTLNEFVALTNQELVEMGKTLPKAFRGFDTLQKGGQIALSTIRSNIKQATEGIGVYAGESEKTRLKFVKLFKDLEQAATVSTGVVRSRLTRFFSWIDLQITTVKLRIVTNLNSIVTAVQKSVAKVQKFLVRALSGFGIAMLVKDLATAALEALGFSDALGKLGDKQKEYSTTLASLNEEFVKFIPIQKVFSASLNGYVDNFDMAAESTENFRRISLKTAEAIQKFSSQVTVTEVTENFIELREAIRSTSVVLTKTGEISDDFFTTQASELLVRQTERWEQLKSVITELGLTSTKEGSKYLSVLEKALDLTKETGKGLREGDDVTFRNLVRELGAAKAALEGILEPAVRINQRVKDIQNSLSQIFSGIVPRTPYDQILDQLEGDIKDREEILEIKVRLEGVDTAFIALDSAVLERQKVLFGVFKKERERLLEAAKLSFKISKVQAKADVRATSRQKARRGLLIQELQLEQQTLDIETKMETIIKTRLIDKGALNEKDIEQLQILEAQLEQYKAQSDLIESQLDSVSRIGAAAKEGLEQNLNTNIYDLIVGDEKSFRDAVLKTAKGVLESIAKELSGQLTDSIIGALGLDLETQRIKDLYNGPDGVFTKGAETISGAVSSSLQKTISDIENSPGIKKILEDKKLEEKQEDPVVLRGRESTTEERFKEEAVKTEGAVFTAPVVEDTLDKIYSLMQQWNDMMPNAPMFKSPQINGSEEKEEPIGEIIQDTIPPNRVSSPDSGVLPQMRESVTIQAAQVNLQGGQDLLGTAMAPPEPKDSSTGIKDLINTSTKPEESKDPLEAQKEIKQLPNRFSEVTKVFTNKLSGIFSSENPLLKGLGGIFEGLFKNLGGLFNKLLGGIGGGGGATNMSGGAGGNIYGQIATGIISFFAASGGIAPGGFRAFAEGGVATSPTLGMVGEGKFNEAIVPLPNGRSIPVEMTKGAGQQVTNSVNLSIDMGSGQRTVETDDDRLTQFGNAITELVQRELVDQSRPGGLLAR